MADTLPRTGEHQKLWGWVGVAYGRDGEELEAFEITDESGRVVGTSPRFGWVVEVRYWCNNPGSTYGPAGAELIQVRSESVRAGPRSLGRRQH